MANVKSDGPKMYEEDTKIEPGSLKWQAAPGWLYCERAEYQPRKSSIVLPGQQLKDNTYRVLSAGPDVEGYKEGDIIAMKQGAACQLGMFIHVKDVLGRLVPLSAPNSAVAVPPKNGLPRGGAEVPAGIDTGKLVEDMTAAD